MSDTTIPAATSAFRDAYRRVISGAERIEKLAEDDLDGLLAIVAQCQEDKKVALARIAEVKSALAQLQAEAT